MQNSVFLEEASHSAYLFQGSPLVHLAGAQQPVRVLIPAQATGGGVGLVQIEEVPPGSGLPRIHREQDEVFFVLEGELEFTLNGDLVCVREGDTVYTPREVPRCFRVVGGSAARLAVLSISGKVTAFELPDSAEELLPCNLHSEQYQHPTTQQCDPSTCILTPTVHGASDLVVRQGEGEIITAFADTIRTVIPYAATGNLFTLGELITPPGGGPPLHVHANEDEFYWIQKGLWQFRVGEEQFMAEAGDRIWAPRSIPHSFRIVSEGAGLALAGATPGDFEQFFRHAAALGGSGDDFGEQLSALAGSFGIRFL